MLMSYSLFGNSFSESLCFIGTSQFISPVQDLTRFCLIRVFTELNLQTHLRAVFILRDIRFSMLMFWVIRRVSIYLFSMPVSLAQWRREKGAFYNNILAYSKISIFCFILSLPHGSIFCRLDLIKLLFLIINLILNGIMFFHFKKSKNNSLTIGAYYLLLYIFLSYRTYWNIFGLLYELLVSVVT